MNGTRNTKLKKSYRYKEEWYLEYGNKYNDHGDVHDESEVDYKMMYEALKKGNLWSLSVCYRHE